MIIWINGAFGAGKTQTAHELHRRLEHSFLYDPENAGYFIRKNTPRSTHISDFQHYPMWRDMNYAMLKHMDESYEGIIIAPMTLVDLPFFDEIIGRLREDGAAVHHYALCASENTLKKRLRGRGERADSWAEQQITRCVTGLSDARLGHHIDTEHKTVSEIAEQIAAMSNLSLLPDQRSKFKKAYDRVLTQVKHIRF
ncbi:AAA family ATPase [Paenibacillus sp. LHD-38]|uniref:AAA family ATPase n=1 Tax=Paenibacillus sp. LHD-38 TaxID=3072143 RepID=UPI00280FEBF8|nr:AAA family ATPase [Paenibacillus sp. LHD-38]MDQ8735310.1 AAA family ATPase [Paenibacillus sp. LHD-38]